MNPRQPGILYGADYSPEQRPPELWPEDMRFIVIQSTCDRYN